MTPEPPTDPTEPRAIAQRVTLIGMILDLVLGISKILVGSLALSQALIADGIHSLSDAVTDVFVLIITRIAHEKPDSDHPYGHARFETLGTVILGTLLIGVAVLLGYDNIRRITAGDALPVPGWPALLVAAISIAAKEWIFHYTRRAGERLRSNLLIANAWHSRTDALSSVIVLVGVAGAMLGVSWLDIAAALAVAAIVAKIGWQLVYDSLKELVDTGLDVEEINAMRETARQVEGVRNIHAIRSRNMGQDVFLDLHILVDARISVSEGHQIGEWVAKRLLTEYDSLNDVIYHVDAEDDDIDVTADSSLLPLRNELVAQLEACWQDLSLPRYAAEPKLHYLDEKVSVELFFSDPLNTQTEQQRGALKAMMLNRCKALHWLKEIKVWYDN